MVFYESAIYRLTLLKKLAYFSTYKKAFEDLIKIFYDDLFKIIS